MKRELKVHALFNAFLNSHLAFIFIEFELSSTHHQKLKFLFE